MRWLWIDRFTEFVSGSHACSIKSVTLTEEQVDDYFRAYPILSPSFVLEGFAQTGGILVSEQSDFAKRVVLAKISKAKFHFTVRPGDTLSYRVELQTIQPDGGLVSCTSHVGDKLHCEAELTFAIVSDDVTKIEFFEPHVFLRMLGIFKLFDVAVDQQGQPLVVPKRLADIESQVLGLNIS